MADVDVRANAQPKPISFRDHDFKAFATIVVVILDVFDPDSIQLVQTDRTGL